MDVDCRRARSEAPGDQCGANLYSFVTTRATRRRSFRQVAATVCTNRTGSRLVARALERVRDGDREALGFLYARYSDDVYGVVRGAVGEHPARELTRLVFARLPHTIAAYDECDAPFDAWIFSLARGAVAEAQLPAGAIAGPQLPAGAIAGS
jgi:hypothetical protein